MFKKGEKLKRIVSGILFALLILSMFTAAFNVESAKANASSHGETVQAADTDWWPMFHHDLNHTGYSTSTGPTTNQTIWNYTASSYFTESSPAVVDGLVYVGLVSGNVSCLNASTGAFVWSYKTGGGVESSPAVVGGLVFVGSGDRRVYCLNAATGALVWNYTTGDSVLSSPAVVGGLVYVGSYDDNVYCLNADNGALVWSYRTGGYVLSSPAVVDGVVYVGSEDGKIYAFGPSPIIPEFPSYLILPLFVMATLLAALVLKRKRNIRTTVRVLLG
jgi:hypothetical protein